MALQQIVVAASAEKRVRNFDCWVFRDELTPPQDPPANGTVVELTSRDGAFLAYAFYNARSHIAARVVSTDSRQPVDRALLVARLAAAVMS